MTRKEPALLRQRETALDTYLASRPEGAASKIDAISADVFDGQPVLTRIEEQDGDVDTLFPKIHDKFHACRKAFNS